MFGRLGHKKITISCLILVLLLSNLPILVHADSNITISGRLVVRHKGDSVNDIVPIPNARVEIYDEESIEYFGVWGHLPWLDTYLGATYTDSDGYFSITVNNDDGSTILGDEKGRDIYLKFMATNQVAEVRNNPGFLLGSVFSFNSDTNRDMEDGEDWDMGNIRPGDVDTQIGFEVLYIAGLAWNHIKETTGQELDKINIFTDDFFTSTTSYYLSDRIEDYLIEPFEDIYDLLGDYYPPVLLDWLDALPAELSPIEKGLIRDVSGVHLFDMANRNTEDYYRVVFHEYGHHIMYELFEGGPPFTVSGTHYLDSEFNPAHAWVEGWAEFYPYVVSEYNGITIQNEGIPNIEALNIAFDYEDEDVAWDSVEGNIASILWDITDLHADNQDGLNVGFGELVNLLMSYDPEPELYQVWPAFKDHIWNIHDVFSAFHSRYDSDTVAKLWVLLNARGIVEADEEIPSIPTSYTSSHNSVIPVNFLTLVVDLHGASDNLSGPKYYYRVTDDDQYELNWWSVYAYSEGEEQYFEDGASWTMSTRSHIEYDLPGYYYPSYYMYVVTFDNAGNWNEEVFKAGPFLVAERPTLEFEGVMTNSVGELVLSGTSTLQVNDPPVTKGYTNPFPRITDYDQNEDDFTFSEVLNFLERPEGLYEIKIYEELSAGGSAVVEAYPLLVDKTAPTIDLTIGEPYWDDDYVSSKTPFTITAYDADAEVKSIQYSFDGTNWIDYSNPFHLLDKPDGSYTIYYRAEDYVGNVASETATVQLDNSAPTFELIIDSPKVTLDKIHVTSETEFSISSFDSGCGLAQVEYRLFSTGGDWVSYVDPFTIIGPDANYTIDYRSSDNLGNVQTKTLTVVLDNSGPQITIISPSEGSALQDVLNIKVDSQDPSGVTNVKFSIQGEEGFTDLPMTYDSEFWVIELNTLNLEDGNYVFEISSTDGLGNTEKITASYSIRNWAVISLLPSTETNKAGRTMPIKFTLRVSDEVDPAQPFVYNENLVIQVFQNGVDDPLQVTTFGDASTDYRINSDTGLYITNFKTLKNTITTYAVKVFGGGSPIDDASIMLGEFTFQTTKK